MEIPANEYWVQIDVPTQTLRVFLNQESMWQAAVSTSMFGVGEVEKSYKTPTGWHRISEKIGDDVPLGAQFVSRRWNNNVWRSSQGTSSEDMILTRILWLDGLEAHNANTKKRFIYIHGTNQESFIGTPQSFGCVRMKNLDMMTLFNKYTAIGTKVRIVA